MTVTRDGSGWFPSRRSTSRTRLTQLQRKIHEPGIRPGAPQVRGATGSAVCIIVRIEAALELRTASLLGPRFIGDLNRRSVPKNNQKQRGCRFMASEQGVAQGRSG